MSKDHDEVIHLCYEWARDHESCSPAKVCDDYPAMMHGVLREWLGLSKRVARDFVEHACAGNFDRLHETRVERQAPAEVWADALCGEVMYCSDRWSWDRVIRVQWLYQELRFHVERELADEVGGGW